VAAASSGWHWCDGCASGVTKSARSDGLMRQAAEGRLRALAFPDLGMNMVHIDDVAAGICLAHDRGRLGEAYVLGGEITTLGELVRKAAAAGGERPPRVTVPSWLVRAVAGPAGLIGPLLGNRVNLAELLSASDGVTYWASDAKRVKSWATRPATWRPACVSCSDSRTA
jgi:hypothetical protein